MLSAVEVLKTLKTYGRSGRPVPIGFLSLKLYQVNSIEVLDILKRLEEDNIVRIDGDNVSLVK